MNKTPKANRFDYLYIIFAIIYSSSIIIASFIRQDELLNFFRDVFGWTLENSFIVSFYNQVNIANDAVYPGLLKIFFIFASVYSVLASVILTAGRTAIEAFLLFFIYLIPRPKNYWGKITNKSNLLPVPFANIRVFSKTDDTENFITEAFSDLYGRYRVNLNQKETHSYYIRVKAEGYEDYRRDLSLLIDLPNGILTQNISLTPLIQNHNLLVLIWRRLKIFTYNNVLRSIYIISTITFVLAGISFLRSPFLGNTVFTILFAFAFLWNTYFMFLHSRIRVGRFIDISTNKPLEGVSCQIYVDDKQLGSYISDSDGLVNFKLDKGSYKAIISKEGYELAKSIGMRSVIIEIGPQGFLGDDIYLRSSGVNVEVLETKLQNPFS